MECCEERKAERFDIKVERESELSVQCGVRPKKRDDAESTGVEARQRRNRGESGWGGTDMEKKGKRGKTAVTNRRGSRHEELPRFQLYWRKWQLSRVRGAFGEKY